MEGRTLDALTIVDELDAMSKKDTIRKIKSYLIVMLVYLIKNQVEGRLTNSWASSIRNAVREIKELNLKPNGTSYYIKEDEWEEMLEEAKDDFFMASKPQKFGHQSMKVCDRDRNGESLCIWIL